ncbi:VWA domain-containing protein [Candidatus Thorarchaeota archaeon]|nr:MAG: VWA domain-containing protein [Candidatus Thorarchaeota archaeon]
METTSNEPVGRDALRVVAENAWFQAVQDFYHPPLSEPEIEHNHEVSSFFYIDSDRWTVHLNTAGVPIHMQVFEAEQYLKSVCHHEIQHYLLCPFDGVMNGRMFTAARKHVNDATAMFVCNLFADLVVDSNLLRRFPSLTHRRINSSIHDSAVRIHDHSDLWKLIVTCYRVMWGFPIPPTVQIDQDIFEAAAEIVTVARSSIDHEHRWPKACEKIAKIIDEWTPDDEDRLPGTDSGGSKNVTQENIDGTEETIDVPLDVDAIMGNPVEARNGNRARKCTDQSSRMDSEEEMEQLAMDVEQLGGDIEELQGVYLTAGIGSERAAWTRFWYRAKARGEIRFEVDAERLTGSVPLTPEVWRLGDPLEELDIVQSLQTFPVLIPNRTTRKWQRFETSGSEHSNFFPDMLIVIDSSGSMTWSMRSTTISGSYHTALVAAFAAMDFAFRRGCRVSAINFSDGTQICDWSTERAPVERVLLSYQGGGTVAPVKKMTEACEKVDSEVITLLITDAEVANWKQLVTSVETLADRGHKVFMFHIGAGKSSRTIKIHEALSKAGATVYPINSIKDLPGLVVREVKSVYRK